MKNQLLFEKNFALLNLAQKSITNTKFLQTYAKRIARYEVDLNSYALPQIALECWEYKRDDTIFRDVYVVLNLYHKYTSYFSFSEARRNLTYNTSFFHNQASFYNWDTLLYVLSGFKPKIKSGVIPNLTKSDIAKLQQWRQYQISILKTLQKNWDNIFWNNYNKEEQWQQLNTFLKRYQNHIDELTKQSATL